MSTTRLTLAAALCALSMIFAGCAGVAAHGGKRPAPGFEVAVVSGMDGAKSVRLEDFRGRPLVLNIGAIWCPHCLHEIPAFNETFAKYKSDVAMLVVFIKSERPAIDEMVADEKPGFIVAHDASSDMGKAYGIKGIPVTYFIDPQGNITDEYLGGLTGSKLTEKIEALMARSAAAAPK